VPPDGEDRFRILARFEIGLDNVVCAVSDAFEKGAEEIGAPMGEVEAEDHPLGMRVVCGRALAREIGE
jgi:hypothetical protein